jgi:hypothetical protein
VEIGKEKRTDARFYLLFQNNHFLMRSFCVRLSYPHFFLFQFSHDFFFTPIGKEQKCENGGPFQLRPQAFISKISSPGRNELGKKPGDPSLPSTPHFSFLSASK